LLFGLPVVGHCVGILIIVKLADIVENSRPILIAVAVEVACITVIVPTVQLSCRASWPPWSPHRRLHLHARATRPAT
jgi:hypothetical protein